MSKKIIFFNHKGGVSKTTSTYNIGWMLALQDKKILLVDADPQCNLTALILDNDFDKYYDDEATKYNNIKDGVKVAFEGKPKTIQAIKCPTFPKNKNLFLLPGHPNLSEYDSALSLAQTSNNVFSALQNLPGAFNHLIELTAKEYDIDLVLIDLNPGLSAINQNLFVQSDYFIIPTNPDPFSVMALNTLAIILPKWVESAERMRRALSEDVAYPMNSVTPVLLGTLIQRFNIRNGKPANPFVNNINEINAVVEKKLIPALKAKKMVLDMEIYKKSKIQNDLCLGKIKDFQSLLQKANEYSVSVFALEDSQLGVGVVRKKSIESRKSFYALFSEISTKILSFIENAKYL